MKTCLIAALAALTPVVSVSAAESEPAMVEVPAPQIVVHDHIRTTLHGSKGPLVVLIPGMSTPGAVWDAEVAALKDSHRVMVVELRGFDGERGTANEAEGALDGAVADIAADLDARNLGPATVAGHSLGGLVAMKLGLARPELVSGLLIVDALPFFGTVFGDAMTVDTIAPQARQMRDMMIAGAETMRAAGERGTQSGAGAAGMSVDEATRVTIANWSLDAEPLAVARLLYEDMQADLRQDISALAMPVTVLHAANGDHAARASARYSTDYAALAQARLVPVENTAHFIQLDRPEIFRAELARLIAQ